MKPNELKLWNIEPFEGCEIECPECKDWSKIDQWQEGSVGCEDCGEHAAIICPKCDEHFDHIWSPEFNVR